MKGCLLRLSLYLPILALFILLFSIREPFPTIEFNPEAGGMALAPVAAFFIWFAMLYLLDARRARAISISHLRRRVAGPGKASEWWCAGPWRSAGNCSRHPSPGKAASVITTSSNTTRAAGWVW